MTSQDWSFCPNCGAKIVPPGEFCAYCGTKLADLTKLDKVQIQEPIKSEAVNRCRKCGGELDQYGYCSNCGGYAI